MFGLESPVCATSGSDHRCAPGLTGRAPGVRAQVPAGALVHALRHTFATVALDHGTDMVELQEILGHASLDTTRGYLEATGAQIRTAVRSHPSQQAIRQIAGGPARNPHG